MTLPREGAVGLRKPVALVGGVVRVAINDMAVGNNVSFHCMEYDLRVLDPLLGPRIAHQGEGLHDGHVGEGGVVTHR